MEQKPLSVSQLNTYIKSKFETDPLLCGVSVFGEISNYKLYPSGHHYFTLKDAESAVRCVMFKGNAFSLRFRPENGMSVLAVGRVSVFPRDGAYQFYCTHMIPYGIGDLTVAFEQLKRKLSAEGLFDASHKKPLPPYPHRIAVITSPAGAAIHDMLRILGQRYPLSEVVLLPVRVQGAEAPPEIAAAIRYANQYCLADVIITGRGGGSAEDLWAFNDEAVARAIYNSAIPVISAVGHEPDVTVSDYVADLRAATPSNAAELVSPDQAELRAMLCEAGLRMAAAVKGKLKAERMRVTALSKAPAFLSPLRLVQEKRLLLDMDTKRLSGAAREILSEKRKRLISLTAGLDAMSPLRVLSRGYSVTAAPDGRIVTSVHQVRPGDRLSVLLKDGSLRVTVEEIKEDTTE